MLLLVIRRDKYGARGNVEVPLKGCRVHLCEAAAATAAAAAAPADESCPCRAPFKRDRRGGGDKMNKAFSGKGEKKVNEAMLV